MNSAYIGLGSNLGDRTANIGRALQLLAAESGVWVRAVSHAYESEPAGLTDQPPFANAVALIEFDGEANALLGLLKDIEERMDREPSERWGPRVIDLDILLFGEEEWDSAELQVPHPRLLQRDFAVTPLLEIAPDATLPDGTRLTRERVREGRIVADLGAIEPVAAALPPADDEEHLPRVLPTPQEAAGAWVPVGPPRYERNTPNSSTDFALLRIEAELLSAGIPCGFEPHRPNEGFATVWGLPQTVRLLVPEDRAMEAERIIAAIPAEEWAFPESDDLGPDDS